MATIEEAARPATLWQDPRKRLWPKEEIAQRSWLLEGHRLSPRAFYAEVEAAVRRREVPDASTSHFDWMEGGVFSEGREYLRVKRERHLFEVCASPFGTGSFVSWRLLEARPSPVIPTIAAVLWAALLFVFMVETQGVIRGGLLTLAQYVAAFFLVGALVAQAPNEWWADHVVTVAFVGKLIERWFLPMTFYRKDTADMFLTTCANATEEVLDALTEAKGIRVRPGAQGNPTMPDFFRRKR